MGERMTYFRNRGAGPLSRPRPFPLKKPVMPRPHTTLPLLALALAPLAAQAQRIDPLSLGKSPRETFLLDRDWKFNRGDIVLPQATGHHENYVLVKAGNARGPAAFQYEKDANWQRVDLPHDYVVDGKYQSNQSVSHGFQERIPAWYRRQFKLAPADREKTVWLYFDGVMGRSQVWVNGQELKQHVNGYIGFRVNITDVAHYGDTPNTVAIRTDPSEPQGWWYEGGGIYRHVWLTKADPVHVAPHGAFADPRKGEGNRWDTRIETRVENETDTDAKVRVVSTVFDAAGKQVGQVSSDVVAKGGDTLVHEQQLAITNPALWSVETPTLHRLRTEIFRDGKKVDEVGTYFGFRTIEFTPDKGIFLNGKPLKLKGVCMHQDHAGVGVAVPDAIQEFRVARMKQMGVNAYRCSHNPPAPEILEACDRLGMVVMNENRFYNSGDIYLEHLHEQTLRDRNHPSVIMWSLFNEEPWQGDERGRKMVERMKRTIRKLDTSRPVTGAMNGGFNKQGAFNAVDIIGINYFLGVHDQAHKLVPDKHVYGSENVSHFATRGEWRTDNAKKTFDNYDKHCAGWGSNTRDAWKHVSEREWDGGMFIWTGFDYRGEPTPHAWPVISSYFGIVDTCGFAKDSFYLCQAFWTDKPMVHVFPHWNLGDDMVGKTVKVGVYTNGDEVELLLNGKVVAPRRKVSHFDQTFVDVTYAPGKLEARAYKAGRPHAADSVETTGAPVALGVEVKFDDWKRTDARTGVGDALPVAVYATDSKGRRVPVAKDKVSFLVDGGRVLGVGNGDPLCHEPDRASSRSLFNGYACAIVEPADGAKSLRVQVTAPGLRPASLTLPVKPGAGAIPQYPSIDNAVVLSAWRLSALTAARQDPNRPIADNDMNTWEPVTAGASPFAPLEGKSGYASVRAEFTMPSDDASRELVFGGVVGAAEVYVNGERVAEKSDMAEKPLRAPVEAAPSAKVVVSVLLRGDGSVTPGFVKTVRLEAAKGPLRKGKAPRLSDATRALAGELKAGTAPQTFAAAKPVRARFLALETLASHDGKDFTHLAELELLDGAGKRLPSGKWKVTYCDSEETDKENARADLIIDGKPGSFWHSRWSDRVTGHPHVVLIDLGDTVEFSSARLTGRDADKVGGLAKFRLHAAPAAFPAK